MNIVSLNLLTNQELGTTVSYFSLWIICMESLHLHFRLKHLLSIIKWKSFQHMLMVVLGLDSSIELQSFSLHQWAIPQCFELIRSNSFSKIYTSWFLDAKLDTVISWLLFIYPSSPITSLRNPPMTQRLSPSAILQQNPSQLSGMRQKKISYKKNLRAWSHLACFNENFKERTRMRLRKPCSVNTTPYAPGWCIC